MKNSIWIGIFTICCNLMYAQNSIPSCGTSLTENLLIRDRMFENREAFEKKVLLRTGAILYIPVTYHLVAKTDGTGRLPVRNALQNLCAINKIYKDQDIVFYLSRINNINNDEIYYDPSSDLGSARIRAIMNSSRNAVNIFVASVANASKTGVLAFYSPNGDYIVSDDDYVNADGSTLAHEIGHFFSLPHTFLGWEDVFYHDLTMNCVNPTPTIIGFFGNLVEYVDRDKAGSNGKKHCEQSADGFCDTPADYNLGFGWPNGDCSYDLCAKDPDNVKLDPDEKNLMSYFLSCIGTFTADQKAAVNRDYLSSKRNYLRGATYVPRPDITGQQTYVSPPRGGSTPGYDIVTLSWDPVEHADVYLLEWAENIGFSIGQKFAITKRLDTTLTDLKPNKVYFWRVYAYNANSTCAAPGIQNFRTPSWTVGVNNELRETVHVETSYVDASIKFTIHATNQFYGSWNIVSLQGVRMYSYKGIFEAGNNNLFIDNLQPGVYMYTLADHSGKSLSGKFIAIP